MGSSDVIDFSVIGPFPQCVGVDSQAFARLFACQHLVGNLSEGILTLGKIYVNRYFLLKKASRPRRFVAKAEH